MRFYSNIHTKETSKIMRKKRKTNSLELLAGLALFGPGTTNDIALFVLRKQSKSSHPQISYREDTQPKQKIYYNLIHDRPRNEDKGKITGLSSDDYIRQTGSKINEKNISVPLFFLTQKGHFLSCGFNFNKDEITFFLKNASKNNLFFAHINSIYEKTSKEFIYNIFIKPIQKLIVDKKIDLDYDFNFYFVNIAQAIGNSVYNETEKIVIESSDNQEMCLKNKQYIEILMDNTFYIDVFSNEWEESLIEHFYPEDSENLEQDFFRKYRDESDSQLLYHVFKYTYSAYYNAAGFGVPKPKNKLPLPKWLREHRRRKNEAKKANKIFKKN